MQLLQAVNLILPKLGNHKVTSLEARDPTIGIIVPEIEQVLDETLQPGWWFNSFDVELYPNSEGYIDVPEDTLSFVCSDKRERVVQRGEQFYNGRTLSYKFDKKIHGRLIQRVPFEELPESFATFITYMAAVNAYVTDLGLEQTVNYWTQRAQSAQAAMEQEHLRQMKFNVRDSSRYRRMMPVNYT